MFVQVVGDKPIQLVTSKDVRAFKDVLLLIPSSMTKRYPGKSINQVIDLTKNDQSVERIATATINKYLNSIKSVFSWATDNQYIEVNPCTKINVVQQEDAKQRLAFDNDDLSKLFGSSIFTDMERPKAGSGEASKWLPLMALYTGCRLEELGQLLVSDVKCDDGIHYIDINTHDAGKSLKTKGSHRTVPLHSELIRLGLLKYVSHLKASKETQLFPLLSADDNGKLTAKWSKWFGRYKGECGIEAPSRGMKDFHSFRHTFKRACRDANVSEEISDALTGHASASVGRGYGGGSSLKVRAEAINKLNYPALRHSRSPRCPRNAR